MTAAPDRIWIWPRQSATGVVAAGSGVYRAEPHRPLDDKDGPAGWEYVRADLVAFFETAMTAADAATPPVPA